MKLIKTNFGIFAFVMVALVLTSGFFIINASSQSQTKDDNKNQREWSHIKREIHSKDSKLALNLPDNLIANDWVVGVIPTKENEPETIVAGVVSWKQGEKGPAFFDGTENLQQESFSILDGQVDLSKSTEFSSLNNGKSLVVLLRLKSGTEINIIQKGDELATKKLAEKGEIISTDQQTFVVNPSAKNVTGPSSLLMELQMRKLQERFTRKNSGGNKNEKTYILDSFRNISFSLSICTKCESELQLLNDRKQ